MAADMGVASLILMIFPLFVKSLCLVMAETGLSENMVPKKTWIIMWYMFIFKMTLLMGNRLIFRHIYIYNHIYYIKLVSIWQLIFPINIWLFPWNSIKSPRDLLLQAAPPSARCVALRRPAVGWSSAAAAGEGNEGDVCWSNVGPP